MTKITLKIPYAETTPYQGIETIKAFLASKGISYSVIYSVTDDKEEQVWVVVLGVESTDGINYPFEIFTA